jgi:peptidoglycan/LPS O-acetylase OafA/YrhL
VNGQPAAPVDADIHTRGRRLLDALTGIRFLAALGVFLFHYGAAFSERADAPRAVTTLLKNGNMGVSFFFVLSGFILTYTYEGRLKSRPALFEYLFARFSRIYPIYLFALVLALPVLTKPLGLTDAVRVLLMTQSWTFPSDLAPNAWVTQAWTLSIELFFYLIFPVALLAIARLNRFATIACMLAVSTTICALGIAKIAPGVEQIPILSRSWTPPLPVLRAFEFVLGMLACKIFLDAPRALRSGFGGWKTYLTALAIVGILASTNSPQFSSFATVLFPILIIQLGAGGAGLAAFLSTRLMLLLGGASYAFYITQGPVREWVRYFVPAPLDGAVNPLAALALAIAAFLFLEQPAQRWLRRAYQRVEAVCAV